MNMNEKKQKINQYFDNELSKEEEILVFTSLSSNEELRDYFKQMHIIKEGFTQIEEKIPDVLDKQILMEVADLNEKGSNKRISFPLNQVFAYSFAIIVMVISIFFFIQSKTYEKKYQIATKQISQQGKMIELIMHSLPETKIDDNFKNEIIINAKL